MRASPRVLLGIGLEALPWIGLAAVCARVPWASLPAALPTSHILLPLLILGAGALAVAGRRGWCAGGTSPSLPSDSSAPARGPDTRADPPSGASVKNEREPVPSPMERNPLSGLPARGALLRHVSQALARDDHGTGDGDLLALLTIEISDYREVTDSFGYEASQELIMAAGDRLREVLPSGTTVAHIGEDTFAVLWADVSGANAKEIGRDLLANLASPFRVGGDPMPIEVTGGLAYRVGSASPFKSAEEMIRASYSAMQQAKRDGDDRLAVARDPHQHETRRLRRRERLREAITANELVLHYQPVVHLLTERVMGAEALVRWDHPERGMLYPQAFLPLAEETGLIGELDRWVVETALQRARRWTRPGAEVLLDWISVNVSPQFVESGLQEWCLQTLREGSLPGGALHIEITERWALRDQRALRSVREEGLRLVLDDFGTGYSSLRYLRFLDADTLKIDRDFIGEVGHNQKATAIVQFLLNLSLRLNVEVIAEGVQTAEQVETLRELGCSMAQGFHFARPLPEREFVRRVSET